MTSLVLAFLLSKQITQVNCATLEVLWHSNAMTMGFVPAGLIDGMTALKLECKKSRWSSKGGMSLTSLSIAATEDGSLLVMLFFLRNEG